MAISSYDALLASLQAGKVQTQFINKSVLNMTTWVLGGYSLWAMDGAPAKGSFGAGAAGTWTAQDSTTTGAINFGNPTAPDIQHLLLAAMSSDSGSSGVMMIYDRLGQIESLPAGSTTGITSITSDFTARLASAEGAQLIAEVVTTSFQGNPAFTVGYTNQAGVAGRTSQSLACTNISATNAASRFPYLNRFFVPLQEGDMGVRSVQSYNLGTAGSGTDKIQLVAVRPLAFIPMQNAGVHVERDFVLATPEIPRIRDNACIALAVLPSSTALPKFNGYIKTVAG